MAEHKGVASLEEGWRGS